MKSHQQEMANPLCNLHYEIEKIHFRTHQPTIIRVESNFKLPRDFLVFVAREQAEETTQIGRYIWARCADWEDALDYSIRFHGRIENGNRMIACAIPGDAEAYKELMEKCARKIIGPHANREVLQYNFPDGPTKIVTVWE